MSCTDGNILVSPGSSISYECVREGVADGNDHTRWRPDDGMPRWGCREPGMTPRDWMAIWSVVCLVATVIGVLVLLYHSLCGFEKSLHALRSMTDAQREQQVLPSRHNSAGATTLCFFLFGILDMIPKSLLAVSMWKSRAYTDNTVIIHHLSWMEWVHPEWITAVETNAMSILLLCFVVAWVLTSLASLLLATKLRSASKPLSSKRGSRIPSLRLSVAVVPQVVHGKRAALITLLSSLTRIEAMAILRLRCGKRLAPCWEPLISSDHVFLFVTGSGMYQYFSKDVPHILVSIALLHNVDDQAYLIDKVPLTHRTIAWVSLSCSVISVIFGLVNKYQYNHVRKQLSSGIPFDLEFDRPLLPTEGETFVTANGAFQIADLDAGWRSAIIGKGSYAIVYRAQWQRTKAVAVKELKLPHGAEIFDGPHPAGMHTSEWNDRKTKFIGDMQRSYGRFIREIRVWKDLKHPNLVKMLAYATEPQVGGMYIMQELMYGLSLAEQLYRRKWNPSERQVAGIALGLADGMRYLHSREPQLIHRDLKGTNVLLSKDPKSLQQSGSIKECVKIADFGLARQMSENISKASDSLVRNSSGMSTNFMFMTTMASSAGNMGSLPWRAPETFDEETVSTAKLDVYSYAMCLVEMVDKRPPWHGKKLSHIQTRVTRQERPEKQVEALASTNSDLLRLIQQCWQQDPRSRPSFDDIVNNPALRQGGPAALEPEPETEPEPEPEREYSDGGFGGSE
jgi:serine/threonine protein kinase